MLPPARRLSYSLPDATSGPLSPRSVLPTVPPRRTRESVVRTIRWPSTDARREEKRGGDGCVGSLSGPCSCVPQSPGTLSRMSSPPPPSLRDSHDSQFGSMLRASSVLSDTSGFEVKYNVAESRDGGFPAMSPLATRKATEAQQMASSSSHNFVARELDAAASPSASPLPTQLAPHHPDYAQQQQQQHAFSFDGAHHSVSPPASLSASPTYSDQSLDEVPQSQQLSSTVRFTPTPSGTDTPAATPLASSSSSASPPLLAHSDSPAAQALLPSQHHDQAFSRSQPQSMLQQQRSTSRPVPPSLQCDADPFQQLSEERTLLMGSSIDMSRSAAAAPARANEATLAKTMMSPAAAALASQRAQNSNAYQMQAEEKQQTHMLTQTVPRSPATAAATVSAVPLTATDTLAASQVLSTLSASALSQKARKIESLIAEFDRKFLDTSTASANAAGPTYPAWVLPFVEEMATKLELVLAAQHRAEEAEAGLGRSVRFSEKDTARRAAERDQARRRVDHIASLRGRQSQSLPGAHFFPEDQYTVGLNDDLPFLRDHGAFAQRRAAPLTQLASPRRNLGIDATTPRDPTLPYQTEARNKHVAGVMASTAPVHVSAAERPQSARASSRRSSERYLTGLLGHDVGASTLNGLFRSTVRSPSPPGGRFQTQAYPGPTIPKAPRFAPVRPLLPPAGLRRKKEGMTAEQRRRERERELEMHALRIRCEELQDALEAERRAQEAAASAPGSPLRLASPRPVAPASSTLDEDALASALLRVGLANREKFLALMQQIQSMQTSMAQQAERMNAAIADGTLGGNRAAPVDAFEAEAAAERHRQMSLELDRLRSELSSTLSEKDRLAAQVRNLASLSEKHKFALMEKQSLLNMSGSDAERKAKQDALLLRTYEQDLRAARDAITQLQGMVTREHSHAAAFKSEAASLQTRLDKLQALLGDSAAKSAALSYQAGRASLKPAQKFQHLMHKYMAGFYRAEFQKLLAERSRNSSHAEQVEVELARTKEKHALELEYQRESHRAVLEHVTGSLHHGSEQKTALEVQLDQAQHQLAILEDQKAEQERELIATERLNAQLQSQLATGSKDPANVSSAALGLDSDFGALMAASFKGDYLTLRNDTRMLKTVYGLGDENILFSDYAQRIDRYARIPRREKQRPGWLRAVAWARLLFSVGLRAHSECFLVCLAVFSCVSVATSISSVSCC